MNATFRVSQVRTGGAYFAVVRECGASVYSASPLAAAELPDVPLSTAPLFSSSSGREEDAQVPLNCRSAVSLGRRATDPLSEYVKLDPTTLGVGMCASESASRESFSRKRDPSDARRYQKDLDAKALAAAVDGAVEDAVAAVGVDVNGASEALLRRVAGLNAGTAAAVATRAPFSSRADLLSAPGGEGTFFPRT